MVRYYNVIGVDIGDKKNYWKIAKSNQGKPPFKSADKNMGKAYLNAKKIKTFSNLQYFLIFQSRHCCYRFAIRCKKKFIW